MSNLENVVCPICNTRGKIKLETDSSTVDEPYLHLLPNKIYCDVCNVEFSHLSLHNDEVVTFQLSDYRQKYEDLLKGYKRLKRRYDLVYEDLQYVGVYRCEHCGHYTMRGYKCHECGHDRTEGK